MPTLTPTAAAALQRAHREARERLEATTRTVEMAAQHFEAARTHHIEATRAFDELAAVLAAHAAELDACPVDVAPPGPVQAGTLAAVDVLVGPIERPREV